MALQNIQISLLEHLSPTAKNLVCQQRYHHHPIVNTIGYGMNLDKLLNKRYLEGRLQEYTILRIPTR